MALVVVLVTPVVLIRTPTDIFPDINIPIIAQVWTYTGLQPQEMEQRITTNVERGITVLVNDIEHIESQSLNGIAIVKIFFHPGVNIQTAMAQVTAISQTFLRTLPQGTTPPPGHYLFRLDCAGAADRADQRPPERAAAI